MSEKTTVNRAEVTRGAERSLAPSAPELAVLEELGPQPSEQVLLQMQQALHRYESRSPEEQQEDVNMEVTHQQVLDQYYGGHRF